MTMEDLEKCLVLLALLRAVNKVSSTLFRALRGGGRNDGIAVGSRAPNHQSD